MSIQARFRILSAAAVTLLSLGGAAHAATLTVTSVGDTPDAVGGDGACGAAGVPNSCTLRAALQEANANADTANTVDLSGVAGTITVTTALPDITKAVAITGPAARVTVSGGDVASLFRFVCATAPCPAGGNYSITNLIVTDGRTTDAAGGGGIYFGAAGAVNFTLSNVDVTSSTATVGPGGGIAAVLVSNNSTLTFSDVRIGADGSTGPDSNGNSAGGDGGGLWVRFDGTTATMTLENASVVNNTSGGNGGGVAVARGRLNIFESSLSGNAATAKGGGIYLGKTGSAGGSARIENVTLSGNTAPTGGGGGIGAAADNPAPSSMIFTTIVNNTGHAIAVATNPGTTFPGNSASFPFTSNVIASNGDLECAAPFAHDDPDHSGYNLTNDSSCGFSAGNNDRFAAPGASVGLAASLDANAADPDMPRTRALLAGSPAIDGGNPNWDTGSDQRGASTQDGGADGTPGDSVPVRDIGAYEFGGFGLVQFTLANYEVAEDQGPAVVAIKRYGTGTAITTTPTVVLESTADTATEGTCGTGSSDYTELASNPMDFAFAASGATQFERAASFAICNDVVNGEGSETFDLALSEPAADGVGYDIGALGASVVTIVDSENGAFRFSPLAYAQNEGSAAEPGSATVTITRTSGSDGAVRVSYATTSTCSPACTATADADYVAASGFVDFADGQLSRTVTVAFVGDDAFEGNETFRVVLTGASCQDLAAGQGCDARLVGAADAPERIATVTIGNDDAAVTGLFRFELESYAANEADGTLTVKVQRVGGSDGDVSVDVAASDGTAEQGADFNVTSPLGGTLTWDAGDASDKTVTIALVNDLFKESNKDFELVLANPQTSTGGLPAPTLSTPNTATVTLVSDEQPAFEFDIPADGYRVDEGELSLELTVTWDDFTGQDVTLPYFTVDGTAISPLDYTGIPESMPGMLTAVAGGDTSATFQVAIKTDAAAEGNETFAATLGTPSGGGELGAGTPATVTIVDPTGARFTAASFTRADEASGGAITATVERFGDLTDPFAVDFEILECEAAGCATQGDDFYRLAGTAGTLSWDAGQGGTRTFSINVQADTLIEGAETVLLALGNPQVGTAPTTNAGALGLAEADGVIPDDDYRFEIVDASPLAVDEGEGNATISVSRVGSTLGAASVSFATADGTAVAGSDYTATASPPALDWAAGEGGIKTLVVPLAGDDVDEPDETFTLALSGPSNNVSGEATPVAGSPLTVSIVDDDATPEVTLSLAGSPVAEGGGTATVTATLSGPSSRDVTVGLAYGGTATAATDYASGATSLVIPAGGLQASTTFSAVDDPFDEPDETVTVVITTVDNGTKAGDPVVATIADDDATPSVTLSLAGSPLAENGGIATVTATLSAPSAQAVTVFFAISGSAGNSDYAASPSIHIPAGETSGAGTVTASDDALDEAAETVVIDIDSVLNGAESGTQQVVATIVDNDEPPSVTLSLTGHPVAENGGAATINAVLSAMSGQDVTVLLAFGGDAVYGTDYTAAATSITIPAGSVEGSAALDAVDDALDEADESVVIDIESVVNGTESGVNQASTLIVDDDASPTVTLAASAPSMAETGGTVTLTATLSAASARVVTVSLGFGGTAVNPADYTASAAAITIPAGATTGAVTLTSAGDGANEPDETVVVDVTSVTNGTESGTQTQTVTIADDDRGGGGGSFGLLGFGLLLPALARRRRRG
jgi:CSLREA domain-containing protein